MHSLLPSVPAPSYAAARAAPPNPAAPRADGKAPVERALNGVRVLLVEDDPLSLKLLEVLLAAEGCKLCSSRSAEEALEAVQSFRPRVAVIDLVLPLASGILLAERLKADPATSNLVLVAVSAINGPQADRSTKAAGFSLYVRKPIDPDSFPGLLLAALRGAQ
jgi:two-component system, cell cycle response regulator DivK